MAGVNTVEEDKHRDVSRWYSGAIVIALIGVVFLVVTTRLWPQALVFDDAYITYRYVRNILSGKGFVYNVGERVLGTTTPLYTLLLSTIASLVSTDLPRLSVTINTIFDVLACLTIFLMGRELRHRWAGLVAAFLYALCYPTATTGMETSLYIFLILLGYYSFMRKRTGLCGILCGLTALVRPDGALVGLTIFIFLLISQRNLLARFTACSCFPVIPWLIFATLYFGNPIPHSVLAKRLAYFIPSLSGNLWSYYRWFHLYFPTWSSFLAKTPMWEFLPVLYVLLFSIGAIATLKKNRLVLPLVWFPVAYVCAIVAGNYLPFCWYLFPIFPFLELMGLIGLSTVWRGVYSKSAGRWVGLTRLAGPESRRTAFSCLVALAVAGFVLMLGLRSAGRRHKLYPADWRIGGVRKYIGRELSTVAADNITVASPQVGVLGYYFDGKIIDTVGLLTPEALHYNPTDFSGRYPFYSIPPKLIETLQPDYLVTEEVFIERGPKRESLRESPFFLENYREVMRAPLGSGTRPDGQSWLLVFQHKQLSTRKKIPELGRRLRIW